MVRTIGLSAASGTRCILFDLDVFYVCCQHFKVGEVHIKIYISASLEISEDLSILDLHAVMTKRWAEVEQWLPFQ